MAIADWLTLSTTAGTGNATVSVTATSYSELLERSTALHISAATTGAYVTVNQRLDPVFLISPSILAFTSMTPTTVSLEITSNMPWTATSIPNWLTLSEESGTGDTTITVTSSANTGTSRTGVITFQNDGGLERSVSVSSVADLSKYVVCTYTTTEPNQVIPLFGQVEATLSGRVFCPSYTDFCTTSGQHGSIEKTESHYMEDIFLLDGVHYSTVDPTYSEYDDGFIFPSAGTHTVYLRFPQDTIQDNGNAYVSWRAILPSGNTTFYWRKQVPFSENPYLTTIYIPSGVSFDSLSEGFVRNCVNLTSIVSEAEGSMVGSFASGCTSLTTFDVPEDFLAQRAFQDCTSLPKFNLNDYTIIGDYALAGCQNFNGEIILSGLTLGDYILSGNTGITKVIALDCVSRTGSQNYEGMLIKDGMHPLDGIVCELYDDNQNGKPLWVQDSSLTKIVWGPSITSGGWYGEFPSSLESWEWQNSGATRLQSTTPSPFENCSALTEITVYTPSPFEIGHGGIFGNGDFHGVATGGTLYYPSGADYDDWFSTAPYWLGYYEWSGASQGLSDKQIKYKTSNSSTTISSAFTGTYESNVYSGEWGIITFADVITVAPAKLFQDCDTVTDIQFPNGVTEIGTSFAMSCTSLTTINLPSALQIIGASAFAYSSLGSVTFPNNLRTIRHSAFRSTHLSELTVPSHITTIGSGICRDCVSLTDVDWETSVDIPQYTFYNCSSLSGVTIDSGVNAIGNNAFQYCESLPSLLTFSSGIKTIGNRAYAYCSGISRVVFTTGLESIGNSAFTECGLATLDFNNYYYSPWGTAYTPSGITISSTAFDDTSDTTVSYRCNLDFSPLFNDYHNLIDNCNVPKLRMSPEQKQLSTTNYGRNRFYVTVAETSNNSVYYDGVTHTSGNYEVNWVNNTGSNTFDVYITLNSSSCYFKLNFHNGDGVTASVICYA